MTDKVQTILTADTGPIHVFLACSELSQ